MDVRDPDAHARRQPVPRSLRGDWVTIGMVVPTKLPQRWSAGALGQVLAGITRAVAALRVPAKPLHPHGDVVLGELRRTGLEPPTGVPWLDSPGTDIVLVRLSRAVGLPAPVPDIFGLALRVPVGQRHGDLLFASTGISRVGRFVLRPHFSPSRGAMTTLLPYRTPQGPTLLAVVPGSGDGFDVMCARVNGKWRQVGTLTLMSADADALVSFDPVRNTVPGLENYDFIRALREPAYRIARRSRQ
ncbi:MAG TPA: hypothetical protein VFQ19_15770 [Nocardioidaceae bacterium]|nr:hypothetical protein [Nocardioidaceae bacterium]